METHSSILDSKILWMEEPSRLQSMGLQRVGHINSENRKGKVLSYFVNWGDISNFYKQLSNFNNIMRNAGLDELQTGIKIAGRKINNLRYADDTTQIAGSEEV